MSVKVTTDHTPYSSGASEIRIVPVQAHDWKAKFADDWKRSEIREWIASYTLKLNGVSVEAVGNGTVSSERTEHYHTSIKDRFDFYAPAYDKYFEVTGTDWTKAESEKRFGYPVLGVLTKKIHDAVSYGVLDKLIIVSVCEAEGQVLFFPASECHHYDRGFFALDEKEYFLVPWLSWRTPRSIAASLKIKAEAC
jgi:hypothetical protein